MHIERKLNMKKKLVLMTTALMAMGMMVGIANTQETFTAVHAVEYTDVAIEKVYGESYSYYGSFYVCLVNDTENMMFKFCPSHDSEIEANRALTPNKVYTYDGMDSGNSYATIAGEKINYKSADFKLISDDDGYIGYYAEVELQNDTYYRLQEIPAQTAEITIDTYTDDYGLLILEDAETGSRFFIMIDNLENGVTYSLSDMTSGYKFCYLGGRYWEYKDASFKRTIDAKGKTHIEASILTVHGDNLDLKYDEQSIKYPLWVGGVQVDEDNMDDVLSDGTISFTPAVPDVSPATLTLNGANITEGYLDAYHRTNGIYYSGSDSLNVVLASNTKNTISDLTYGLISNTAPVVFSGSGSLNATVSSTGFYGSEIIVESGTIVATGTGEGGYGISAYGKIEINGGSVTATGLDIGVSSYIGKIYVKEGASLTAIGGTRSFDGNVVNEFEGKGWTDVAGTEGEAVIEVSESGQNLLSFRKVVFKSHTHVWDENWTSDETHHWHACLGDDATDECLLEVEAAYAEHTYGETGEARFTCTVCGHVDNNKKAAAELLDAKEAAKKALDDLLAGKNESDYDPEDWAALKKIIEDAKAQIDNASSIETVNSTESDAEDQVALIKTIDQKPTDQPQGGLPAGAVVGIVIGSILLLALIACGVLFLLHKKRIIVIPFLNKNKEE